MFLCVRVVVLMNVRACHQVLRYLSRFVFSSRAVYPHTLIISTPPHAATPTGKFGRGYGGAGGGVCCKSGCKRCGGGEDGDKDEDWCKNQVRASH